MHGGRGPFWWERAILETYGVMRFLMHVVTFGTLAVVFVLAAFLLLIGVVFLVYVGVMMLMQLFRPDLLVGPFIPNP